MYGVDTLRRELRELEAELDDIYAMSDEALQFAYNNDNRDEIVALIKADINDTQSRIDDAEYYAKNDPDAEVEDRLYHFAFPTEADFWAYKGY